MKEQRRNEWVAPTLLFAVVIFCVLVISVLVALLLVFIMSQIHVFWEGGIPSAWQLVLFLVIISVIVGLVISLVVSKVSLKPVNRIITLMNRLASGDFRVRLTFGKILGSHASFRAIAKSFNKMAVELENTEMLRADFVNNFSHEFKTPIVSIAGFAKLLRRGGLPEREQQEYLAIIEEESLRLANMASSVLSLTRVENQEILTELTRYNLSEQLRTCVLLLETRWSKKNLVMDPDFEEYTVRGDEKLLQQVWINLLDNAIKFSPEGGEISVRISACNGWVRVTVTNFGPDIPPDKQERIFRKFYQADESHAAQGNGVGLAVVKRVAELHGGSVAVSSGGGVTTFAVELPQGIQ